MTNLKKVTALALCASALLALPAQALEITNFDKLTRKQIEQSYYFDWSHNSTFRVALIKAFKSSNQTIPTWLRKGGGPAAPAKIVDSGATHFVLLNTCKMHDCGNNNVYVLFDPVTKTTALAGKVDNKPTWIGATNGTIKQILSSASGIR